MAEDVGSPQWWLKKLKKELDARQEKLKLYDAYYSGEHKLKFASPKFRAAFGGLFANFSDNWCELVVNSVEERLNIQGFRLGEDTSGDQKAWDIWQSNQLDAESQIAHQEALINGVSYVLVWEDEEGNPEITVEHPQQAIVAFQPGSRRKRAAGLKCWEEDDGSRMATLYLPDEIWKFKARKGMGTPTWEDRVVDNEERPLPNTLGVVPLIPLVNRPRLLKPGDSEIRQVIPIQDATNKTIIDMLVASEVASFAQRWAAGLEVDEDPETKEKIQPFKAGADQLWISGDPNTKFGQFEATELKNYVNAIEMFVQHIASQTRTPPHYFYLSGNFPSGESIKSAETGLTAKVRRKMVPFGETWEEVMRLAFKVAGDRRRALILNTEVIWGDPESRSESEHIDAIVKKKALGVPDQQLQEDAGYTPPQIERFKAMLAAQPQMPVEPVTPEPQPAA